VTHPTLPPADGDDGTDVPPVVISLRLPGPGPRTPPPSGATTMRVITEGAAYLLDPVSMTAVRLRRHGATLRRDGEALTLLSWPTPVVGRGMQLQVLVREDGVPTIRFTSAVVQVEQGSTAAGKPADDERLP
jgi:hypothetical protein